MVVHMFKVSMYMSMCFKREKRIPLWHCPPAVGSPLVSN